METFVKTLYFETLHAHAPLNMAYKNTFSMCYKHIKFRSFWLVHQNIVRKNNILH